MTFGEEQYEMIDVKRKRQMPIPNDVGLLKSLA